ncbi:MULTISPECIES: DUF6153 family protein [unclassified Streptomyces]|uniref:DUF6153 family protein n=1 Tax=unclassified Streptomyces TaxID=2593676 RepID=UPI003650712F
MASARDEAVNRLGQLVRPRSTSRFVGLLVCTLLLGLVGMHGLGPVPAGAAAHDPMPVAAPMGVVASMPDACDHGEGGGCTGHAQHADPTCASASVAGSPAMVPVLLPDVAACAGVPKAVGASSTGSGPDGGRAPPSLSELQLLRI